MAELSRVVLLGIIACALALRGWLAVRQIAYLRRQRELGEAEARARAYAIARARLEMITAFLETALILLFTLGGGIAWLSRLGQGRTMLGAVLVGTVTAAFAALRGALRLYQARVLDPRFGFAPRASLRLLATMLPQGIIAVAVAAAMGAALTWLMDTGWEGWWLGAASLWSLVLFARICWQPALSALLGNRARPLTEGPLQQRLQSLLNRAGLGHAKIYRIESAFRSHRANARLAGVGRWRRIELSATLLKLLAPAELEAVIAHELGHWHGAHMAWDFALRALAGFFGFALLAGTIGARALGSSVGLGPEATAPAFVATGAALLPLTRFFLTPLVAFLYRNFEYAADAFAARHTDPYAFIRALEKLHVTNATVRASDPLYAGFYASHPEPAARIRRLEALARKARVG
jgi:STE24 endopeptidase